MCTIGHGSLLPCQNTINGGIFKKKKNVVSWLGFITQLT